MASSELRIHRLPIGIVPGYVAVGELIIWHDAIYRKINDPGDIEFVSTIIPLELFLILPFLLDESQLGRFFHEYYPDRLELFDVTTEKY